MQQRNTTCQVRPGASEVLKKHQAVFKRLVVHINLSMLYQQFWTSPALSHTRQSMSMA